MRLWLVKAIAAGISLTVAFICIEILLRITGRDQAIVWRPDPVLGWWHVPHSRMHWTSEGDGYVTINALRMRDEERTVAKSPGVFRIAVFGDSMTESVQVNLDQTFCHLLQTRLSESNGRPVEVLNFGVNGYSPLQEYLLYREYGREFAPDLVIHAIFLDNDIADLHAQLATGQRGAPFLRDMQTPDLDIDYSAAQDSTSSYDRQPVAFVRQASALYRFASDVRSKRRDAAAFQAGKAAGGGVPRRYLLYAEDAPAAWDTAWTRLERIVPAFEKAVRADGAKYAIVSVPAGQIVNEEIWNALAREYPDFAKYRWNRFRPEERLTSFAHKRTIPFVAPLETFLQSPNRRDLFFGSVGHFRPEGHQLMTAFLAQELTKLGLIPAKAE